MGFGARQNFDFELSTRPRALSWDTTMAATSGVGASKAATAATIANEKKLDRALSMASLLHLKERFLSEKVHP